ncbi:hypothetical protein J2857_003643 [Neorhizobium galegae]|nr:hypothetical protein [Neorhizobium galegae]MBP2560874.1 hypothetical protein [Neorhizobium galegae]
MSEERTTTHPSAPVHFEHWCEVEGCNKWGGLGFGKGAQPMRWWCAEHYPHWDRKPDVSQDS